jgi:hypothetical protein
LIAVVHAEHRQVIDQLSVLLRTPPTYDDEWHSFATSGRRTPTRTSAT